MKYPKLKIVHVIFSLSSGGAERVVLNLCNEQVKENDVVLVTIIKESIQNSFYLPQLDERVKYINLNSKRGIQLSSFIKINKIIKQEQPNIAHYHLNTILFGIWPALINHVKSVHTLHNIAELTLGFKGQKWINKWIYKTNKIKPIALSKECAYSVKKVYGLEGVPIVLNGVPEFKKSQNYKAAERFMKQFKTKVNSLVYVHLARYNPQKNQSLLFSVFNDIIIENRNVHLIVIGRDFPSMDYPNIHFLGEIINPLDYVSNADAMVLSSFYEGIPMSIIEGFSCGVPVVSTPAGGMIDILKDENLGLLSVDFSYESFKEAIKTMNFMLLNNDFTANTIKEMFRNNYSVTTCSENYMNIYLEDM